MSSIYVLRDPRDGRVRYVGKTTKEVQVRLKGHIEKSRDLSNRWHVANWIRSLDSFGLKPEIEKIREVADEYLDDAERFCIKEFKRLGCDLTNGTEGGDGGITGNGTMWTAEAIRKRRENARGKPSPRRGMKQSPELVAKRMASYTKEARVRTTHLTQERRKRTRELASIFDGYDPYIKGVWWGGYLYISDDFTPQRDPSVYKLKIIQKRDLEFVETNTIRRRRTKLREPGSVARKKRKSTITRWSEPIGPNMPYTPSEETKQVIRENTKKQWESYDEQKRLEQKELFQRNAEAYREKIRSGEIVDPRKGRVPANKGVRPTDEQIEKMLATSKANKLKSGFRTQRQICEEISERCGHSVAKVERTLKGYIDKVAEDVSTEIVNFYLEHKSEYLDLKVKL